MNNVGRTGSRSRLQAGNLLCELLTRMPKKRKKKRFCCKSGPGERSTWSVKKETTTTKKEKKKNFFRAVTISSWERGKTRGRRKKRVTTARASFQKDFFWVFHPLLK